MSERTRFDLVRSSSLVGIADHLAFFMRRGALVEPDPHGT